MNDEKKEAHARLGFPNYENFDSGGKQAGPQTETGQPGRPSVMLAIVMLSIHLAGGAR